MCNTLLLGVVGTGSNQYKSNHLLEFKSSISRTLVFANACLSATTAENRTPVPCIGLVRGKNLHSFWFFALRFCVIEKRFCDIKQRACGSPPRQEAFREMRPPSQFTLCMSWCTLTALCWMTAHHMFSPNLISC